MQTQKLLQEIYQDQNIINKINDLFGAMGKSIQTYDTKAINKAIELAAQYHSGQVRASGDPYIIHPIAVAEIAAEMNLDTASIITAILHDTVEDTELSVVNIETIFGKDISILVEGVTKLTRLEFKSDQMKQAENFRKLFVAMSEDIRVLLVKLADRLHNMRTIHFLTKEAKKQRIALETMEIYAPLAERMGMHNFKTELQDIAFEVLYPNVRESILCRLNEIAHDGATLIDKIIQELQDHLKSENIEATVMGRQKTPYSIWMKMNQKNVSFDQLSDIIAFRIIVQKPQDCYLALGVIHGKYKMVPENFQDFISTPKHNAYQSIHTLVIGPLQQRIEVQIRTNEMHEIAEFGVAAHWRYKQKYLDHCGKQFRWIRELLSVLDQAKDPEEFISNTKLEMYYDQVFCFTPKGKLIALPKGASTIDFAYGIHSEVGNHCIGAKVNGQLAPLKTILKNGDQVEILTSKNQVLNQSWEAYVVTGRAKSEIRKFLRQQSIEQFSCLGKDMLEKAFKSVNMSINQIDLEIAITKFRKTNAQDLFCSIGDGNIDREEVLKLYKPKSKISDKFFLFKFVKTPRKQEAVSIKGLVSGMAIHYAGCCHPIPGDSILGVIHTGKGITIHSAGCEYLEHLKTNEFEPVLLEWNHETNQEAFVTRVSVKIINEPGGIASISSAFAQEKCNIVNFKIINRSIDFYQVIVDVEVTNVNHLNTLLTILRRKKEILQIDRIKT